MRIRDIVSWNALLLGYADNEQNDSAVEMFFGHLSTDSSDSTAEFLSPNSRTYVSVLKACGNTSDLEAGRLIHRSVCRDGKECEEILVTSLVDFYGKSGKTSCAQQVFDSVGFSARSLIVWNALIAGYNRGGEVDRVLDLFREMVERDLQPDRITFISVLSSFARAGLADKGVELLQAMEVKYGVVGDVEHFNCVIDSLCRVDKNRIGEAVELARGMPCEASVVTWTSLLDGCRKWKDVKRAEEVFKLLSDAGEAGAYDLLLNTYLDC